MKTKRTDLKMDFKNDLITGDNYDAIIHSVENDNDPNNVLYVDVHAEDQHNHNHCDNDNISREWVLRTSLSYDESMEWYRSYVPQVGDAVIYVPRAHFPTVVALTNEGRPWEDNFPSSRDENNNALAWPAVRCEVKHIRYKFPIPSDIRKSILAIVTLQITGVPPPIQESHSNKAKQFPWLAASGFVPLTSKLEFDLNFFQNDQPDFLLPEYIYAWRLHRLEKILNERSDAQGLKLVFFSRDHVTIDGNISSEECNEDPIYKPVCCVLKNVSQVAQVPSGTSPHIINSGFESIEVQFTNDEGEQLRDLSPWEVDVEGCPLPLDIRPSISENEKDASLQIVRGISTDGKYASHFVDIVEYSNKNPDYSKVVENPMSLTVVQKRLESNYYSSLSSVAFDIALILNNAYKYDQQSRGMSLLAAEMYERFTSELQKRIAEMRKDRIAGYDDPNDFVTRRYTEFHEKKSAFGGEQRVWDGVNSIERAITEKCVHVCDGKITLNGILLATIASSCSALSDRSLVIEILDSAISGTNGFEKSYLKPVNDFFSVGGFLIMKIWLAQASTPTIILKEEKSVPKKKMKKSAQAKDSEAVKTVSPTCPLLMRIIQFLQKVPFDSEFVMGSQINNRIKDLKANVTGIANEFSAENKTDFTNLITGNQDPSDVKNELKQLMKVWKQKMKEQRSLPDVLASCKKEMESQFVILNDCEMKGKVAPWLSRDEARPKKKKIDPVKMQKIKAMQAAARKRSRELMEEQKMREERKKIKLEAQRRLQFRINDEEKKNKFEAQRPQLQLKNEEMDSKEGVGNTGPKLQEVEHNSKPGAQRLQKNDGSNLDAQQARLEEISRAEQEEKEKAKIIGDVFRKRRKEEKSKIQLVEAPGHGKRVKWKDQMVEVFIIPSSKK